MKFSLSIPIILILLAATLGLSAQQDFQGSGSTSSSSRILLEECSVTLIQDIELPSLESGQLTRILVKPGDAVSKNQKVAQMDDKRSRRAHEEASYRHQIANSRANDKTEVNTAYKRAELAYAEHSKTKKLRRSGSMSEQQAERAKVSAEIAQLEYQGAKKVKMLAGIEAAAERVTVQASQDSIDRHSLESPINGVVYEVARDSGEWVTAGEPVMRIAQMDRLKIIGFIDGNKYTSGDIKNCEVTAEVRLPNGTEQFKGRVTFVEGRRSIKNEFRIWAEVNNRTSGSAAQQHWVLQPGNIVNMEIHLGQQPPIQAAANPARGVNGGSFKRVTK